MNNFLYRFNDTYDENHFTLDKYIIYKHTPKGVWIYLDNFYHCDTNCPCKIKRFIRNNTYKKFACETIEEAAISYIARKRKQIKILTKQLNTTQDALNCFLIKNKPIPLWQQYSLLNNNSATTVNNTIIK